LTRTRPTPSPSQARSSTATRTATASFDTSGFLQASNASNCSSRHDRWRSSSVGRSEEHTSELQSRENLVCRLLLEKKKEEDNKPKKNIVAEKTKAREKQHSISVQRNRNVKVKTRRMEHKQVSTTERRDRVDTLRRQ